MELIVRILGSPATSVPSCLRHKRPFRFGRQTVTIDFGVEGKTIQVRTMFSIIKLSRDIRIGGIAPLGLATFVREKHRIVISHIRCRIHIRNALHLEPRCRFHQGIEVSTSHLIFPNRKIIGQQDIHLRAFRRLCRSVICSQVSHGISRNTDHTRKGIFSCIHSIFVKSRCTVRISTCI